MLKDGRFWTGVIVGAIFVSFLWPMISGKLKGAR